MGCQLKASWSEGRKSSRRELTGGERVEELNTTLCDKEVAYYVPPSQIDKNGRSLPSIHKIHVNSYFKTGPLFQVSKVIFFR